MPVGILQLLQVYTIPSFQMFFYPEQDKLAPGSIEQPRKQNFNAHAEAQAKAKMLCIAIETVVSRTTPDIGSGTTLPPAVLDTEDKQSVTKRI